MTVTFDDRDGLYGRLRKRFTGKRSAPRQVPPAVVPLHGHEDDDDVDDSALLLAGEGYLWLLPEECGDAKFLAEVFLGHAAESWGTRAFFVTNGGELVAEWVETSDADRFVLNRVETMENDPPIPC